MLVKLSNVRLAFWNGFVPQSVNGSDPKYGATFIMPPKHPACKELEAAMKEVAVAKWGAKADAVLSQLKKTDKVCYRSGDLKENYEGFAGNMFISSSSVKRPAVYMKDKTPATQADGVPYSGCYVAASVDIWAQDNQFGKRINATLRWVQFYKDGDSFGGGGTPVSDDEIDDLSDTGEEGEEESMV